MVIPFQSKLLVIAVVACLTFSNRVYAGAHEEADSIAAEIMSPFCPGRLLRDCPSSAASDLRKDIEVRLDKGESPDKITESLYAMYGDEVRAAPKPQGFGLIAWVAPGFVLLLGVVAIWAFVSIRAKTAMATELELSPTAVELDSKSKARVNAALSEE